MCNNVCLEKGSNELFGAHIYKDCLFYKFIGTVRNILWQKIEVASVYTILIHVSSSTTTVKNKGHF